MTSITILKPRPKKWDRVMRVIKGDKPKKPMATRNRPRGDEPTPPRAA